MPKFIPLLDPNKLPKPGTIFSSYRDLARFLGEPIQTGSSMNAQMKRWLRQFTWERVEGTHKVLIKHFEPPLLELTSEPQWTRNLEPLLLHELVMAISGYGCNSQSQHFKELILSGTEAYIRFGLVNPSWTKLRNAGLEEEQSVSQHDFMEFSSEKLYDVFYNTLRQLERRGICMGRRCYIVEENEKFRITTDEELRWLQLETIALLADMKVWNERRLFRFGLSEKFYTQLGFNFHTEFSKKEAEIYLGHKVWRITYLPKRLEKVATGIITQDFGSHRRLCNLESLRWHVKELGTKYGSIINMVIPQQDLLTYLDQNTQ